METGKDSLVDLERRRAQLEQNVSELQGLLHHWRSWEAEYEGLKEELLGLKDSPSSENLQEVVTRSAGSLLKLKEIEELLRDAQGNRRDRDQIVGLLSRRIDYVQENVKAAKTRYEAVKEKLAAVEVVLSPEPRDDEGLPLAEITEELDDDDNVLASYVTNPKDSAPQLLRTLEGDRTTQAISNDLEKSLQDGSKQVLDSASNHDDIAMKSPGLAPAEAEVGFRDSKKVRFAETVDVKSQAVPDSHQTGVARENKHSTKKTVHSDVVEKLQAEGAAFVANAPATPSNGSRERTTLEEEMHDYGLNEVGAIVAEMNIENEDDDFSSITDESTEDSDLEDAFGRTTRRIVSEDYENKMLELERKLNAKSLTNIGPHPEIDIDSTPDRTRAESHSALPYESQNISTTDLSKKSVRFTNDLSIQESPSKSMSITSNKRTEESSPSAGNVVERGTPIDFSAETKQPRKVSKFKATRARKTNLVEGDDGESTNKAPSNIVNGPLAGISSSTLVPVAASRSEPTQKLSLISEPLESRATNGGARKKVQSDIVVERPLTGKSEDVTEPDELDPALMQQQTAVEFYRMRNQRIQRQGGFSGHDDDSAVFDKDGKQISRFRAARMSK